MQVPKAGTNVTVIRIKNHENEIGIDLVNIICRVLLQCDKYKERPLPVAMYLHL